MPTQTLSVADRLEIQELLAQSISAIDTGQADAWVATFATDGSFIHSSGKPFTGHEELRRFALTREPRSYVHWTSNIIITPSGDGAQSQCYVMMVEQMPDDSFRIKGMSKKTDDLRRENGQWRFMCRRSAAWPAPARG